MSLVSVTEVQRVLANEPTGLTTAELAQRLGIGEPRKIVSVLSKLADYGKIAREHHQQYDLGRNKPTQYCVWKIKPEPATHV